MGSGLGRVGGKRQVREDHAADGVPNDRWRPSGNQRAGAIAMNALYRVVHHHAVPAEEFDALLGELRQRSATEKARLAVLTASPSRK